MANPPRDRFVLTIEDLEPDAIASTPVRLRGVLKRLLRTHQFKCISIKPETPATTSPVDPTTTNTLTQPTIRLDRTGTMPA